MIHRKIGGFLVVAMSAAAMHLGTSVAVVHAEETAPAVSCAVPVCDIPQEIAKYRQMRQALRYDNMRGLLATHRNTMDLAILRNLADFAGALEQLFVEVREEDWMIRDARSFRATMLLSLAKYSELNAEVLSSLYRQITGEAPRYAVFSYWRDRVAQYEDKTSLMELLEFFHRMAQISRTEGDPDYIARDAIGVENAITTRMVQLYPYFEGAYQVSVSCDGRDVGGSLGSYCNNGFLNRLVVMDTLQGSLQISLANRESGLQIFSFNNVLLKDGGTTFEANGSPSGVPSQLRVTLDKATGRITGWIRNADSLTALRIEGQLEASPAAVYDLSASVANKTPLTAAGISRTYRGQVAGRNVTFTLASFGDDRFGGTMSFDDVRHYRVRFQFSRFYPRLGILVLVGAQPGGSNMKMTLFFRNTSNGMEVQGMGFTDLSGAVHEVSLTAAQQ